MSHIIAPLSELLSQVAIEQSSVGDFAALFKRVQSNNKLDRELTSKLTLLHSSYDEVIHEASEPEPVSGVTDQPPPSPAVSMSLVVHANSAVKHPVYFLLVFF